MEVAENDVDAGVDLKENLEKQAEFQHKIVHLDRGKLHVAQETCRSVVVAKKLLEVGPHEVVSRSLLVR